VPDSSPQCPGDDAEDHDESEGQKPLVSEFLHGNDSICGGAASGVFAAGSVQHRRLSLYPDRRRVAMKNFCYFKLFN
jgi:hypothetical protein